MTMDGTTLVVGARENEDGLGGSGKVYVFNVDTGALIHTIDNPNVFGTVESDEFGESVSVDGDKLIVGAAREDEATGTGSGKAYIFKI